MADGLPSLPGPMPSSFDDSQELQNERPLHKAMRKLREEPLVPLGMGLTVLAFVNSYRALRRGDSKQANRMFRARVAAQAFTVIAMVAGSMYYSKDREKTKELRKLKEQQDAEEKRIKWIRELEARDEEEKAMKAHLQRRFQGGASGAAQTTETDQPKQEGTGGMLSKMGLWSKGEAKAAEDTTSELSQPAKTEKKKNPKSSLGDLGEIISSKKKD